MWSRLESIAMSRHFLPILALSLLALTGCPPSEQTEPDAPAASSSTIEPDPIEEASSGPAVEEETYASNYLPEVPDGQIAHVILSESGEVTEEIKSLEEFHLSDWGPRPYGEEFLNPTMQESKLDGTAQETLLYQTAGTSSEIAAHYEAELEGTSTREEEGIAVVEGTFFAESFRVEIQDGDPALVSVTKTLGG